MRWFAAVGGSYLNTVVLLSGSAAFMLSKIFLSEIKSNLDTRINYEGGTDDDDIQTNSVCMAACASHATLFKLVRNGRRTGPGVRAESCLRAY